MPPVGRDGQDHLRLGIVPGGGRQDVDFRPDADGGQRLRLGEDLRIGADTDLEIGRPEAALLQDLLDPRRIVRARHDIAQIVADFAGGLGADVEGAIGIAFRLLLDYPFQHAGDEGDAAGLQRLQVRGCQQVGGGGVAAIMPAGRQHLFEAAEPGARGGADPARDVVERQQAG